MPTTIDTCPPRTGRRQDEGRPTPPRPAIGRGLPPPVSPAQRAAAADALRRLFGTAPDDRTDADDLADLKAMG